MAFRLVEKGIKAKIRDLLRKRIDRGGLAVKKTLALGNLHVDIKCHTEKIISSIDRQLKFSLCEYYDKVDGQIFVWEERSGIDLLRMICEHLKLHSRILTLFNRQGIISFSYFFYESKDDETPIVVELDSRNGRVEVYDRDELCCYCGFEDFSNEVLVKHGHLFFRQIHFLCNNDVCSLVHGAVIGWDGNGILVCAKGKCGKSTLSIKSLLCGAEYVAEDYQILESDNKKICASPIYSVVTLGNDMYELMRGEFYGSFYSFNWDKSKSVYDVSCYVDSVRTHYPIKMCLFPQFVQDAHASIEKCGEVEKGRAILHLIYSTLMQTHNLGDFQQTRKLFNMLCDMPFYRINLSPNISENTIVLRNFVKNNDFIGEKWKGNGRYLMDITFGKMQILDLKEFCFYELNEFATYVYNLLKNGKSVDEVLEKLALYSEDNELVKQQVIDFGKLLEKWEYRKFPFFSTKENDLFSTTILQNIRCGLSVQRYIGNDLEQLI